MSHEHHPRPPARAAVAVDRRRVSTRTTPPKKSATASSRSWRPRPATWSSGSTSTSTPSRALYFAPAFFPKSRPDRAAAQHRRRVRGRLPDAADRRLAVRPHRRPARAQDLDADLGDDDVRRLAGHRLPADLRADRRLGALPAAGGRLFQGLSVGGEYGTTATYMSEVALRGQRGFFSSFQYVTLIGGQLLAVLVIVVLRAAADRGRAQGLGLAHSVRDRRHRGGGRAAAAPHAARNADRRSRAPTRKPAAWPACSATTRPPSSRCWATPPAAR